MKIVGHANDYGIAGKSASPYSFQYQALKILQKWLRRRSNHGYAPFERLQTLLRRFPRTKMNTQFLRPGIPSKVLN